MALMDDFIRLQQARYSDPDGDMVTPVANGRIVWRDCWGVYVEDDEKPVGVFFDEAEADGCADGWSETGYSGRVCVRPFRLGEFLSETEELF